MVKKTEDYLSRHIDEENKYWDKIFREELENDKSRKKYFSSLWWEKYYSEITQFVRAEISRYHNVRILEAGSGSGKASILLGKHYNITLLDISKNALKYAKYLSKKHDIKEVEFINGNLFFMPFGKNEFDFVWNIGVLEHYIFEDAVRICREMLRVVKSNGKIAVGVPNFSSGPAIKARILGIRLLSFLPGYRFKTENNYKEKDLVRLFRAAAKMENKKIKKMSVQYFGNPLPMGSPEWLLNSVGKILDHFLPKSKFLTFVICKIE